MNNIIPIVVMLLKDVSEWTLWLCPSHHGCLYVCLIAQGIVLRRAHAGLILFCPNLKLLTIMNQWSLIFILHRSYKLCSRFPSPLLFLLITTKLPSLCPWHMLQHFLAYAQSLMKELLTLDSSRTRLTLTRSVLLTTPGVLNTSSTTGHMKTHSSIMALACDTITNSFYQPPQQLIRTKPRLKTGNYFCFLSIPHSIKNAEKSEIYTSVTFAFPSMLFYYNITHHT